ncbi:MAG: Gfo/Idh/MocA family oxidoreductase [Bacteroidia bacterium]|nr:Gfo/Idh/MocA family oxidoreductase [Bacteroidia bacterium]
MIMELQFAIAGCGNIAPRHAENIKKHGKLSAVCDIVPEKANELAKLYTANAYYSFDEMLEKEPAVSIVVICTPNGLHAEHTIKALQDGRHVICEKPMCLSLPAAWSMRDTAHFFRRNLFVVKQNRFNPPVLAVKELLDENKLGKITGVQVNGFWNRDKRYYTGGWKGTKELDGGILFTQYSHFIDLVCWFFGAPFNFRSSKKNLLLQNISETEDNLVSIAELPNGALCTFHFSLNSFGSNMEGSITVIGEKGTVKIGGQYLNVLEYQCVEGMERIQLNPAANPNDYGFYQGSMSNHDKVYENIIQVLKGNSSKYTNAEDGLKTVEVIERMYASCQ